MFELTIPDLYVLKMSVCVSLSVCLSVMLNTDWLGLNTLM